MQEERAGLSARAVSALERDEAAQAPLDSLPVDSSRGRGPSGYETGSGVRLSAPSRIASTRRSA
jgi:hypothetical protein